MSNRPIEGRFNSPPPGGRAYFAAAPLSEDLAGIVHHGAVGLGRMAVSVWVARVNAGGIPRVPEGVIARP